MTAADLRAFADAARVADGRVPVTVEIGSGHAGVEVKETSPPDVALRLPAPARAR